MALFLESVWDSAEDAAEFYRALEVWLQRRFPNGKRPDSSADGFEWIENGEHHSVQQKGSRIRLMVGIPQLESAKLKGY